MNETRRQLDQFKNRIHQPMYDTAEFNSTMNEVNFFSVPRGQPFNITGVQKTIRHTNHTQANQMPAENRMIVQTVQVGLSSERVPELLADPMAIYERLFNNSVLSIICQDKTFLRVPTKLLCLGGGPHYQFAPGNLDAYSMVSNGFPFARAIWTLSMPIILEPKAQFSVSLNTADEGEMPWEDDGEAIVRLLCVLDGTLERNVN